MNKEKIGIIIQARMGSTRLPGKVLKEVCGKTVVSLIIERLRKVSNSDIIVLATSINKENDVLAKEAEKNDIECFRGSEENVLDRFYQASKKNKLDIIVRVTADCPIIDPFVIDGAIDFFKNNKVDIVSNTEKRTFPHGLDFEVFSFRSLELAWNDERHRLGGDWEKVFVNPTNYIKKSGKFVHKDILNEKDFSNIRITMDYPEDFILIEKIFEELYSQNSYFDMNDVLSLISDKPGLLSINKQYVE